MYNTVGIKIVLKSTPEQIMGDAPRSPTQPPYIAMPHSHASLNTGQLSPKQNLLYEILH